MTAVAAPTHVRASARDRPKESIFPSADAPILAAVDGSAESDVVVRTAVRLARDLNARVVFAHVRRGPPGFLGTPMYQRRLTADMRKGRRVLNSALGVARGAGIAAEGELVEGSPRRRIVELARSRGARLVVVGSRRRKLGRSVSRAVVRSAERPVVVTRAAQTGS
jgi:nucleotide-binding universal stress UspA family protein